MANMNSQHSLESLFSYRLTVFQVVLFSHLSRSSLSIDVTDSVDVRYDQVCGP
jgi:hypothetical protein